MVFVIYLLFQVELEVVLLVLYWLFGLICIDENFMQKVGVQWVVVELGLVLVVLDISLCGSGVFGDFDGVWDFGLGVGFYLNVMQEFWFVYYCMYDYVVYELLVLIEVYFLVFWWCGISGYLMGGYGVLVCVLCNLGCYLLLLVFVLICYLSDCFWGQKVFFCYLGEDLVVWCEWDVCVLFEGVFECLLILVDQGEYDDFFVVQFKLEVLCNVVDKVGYLLELCL